MSNLECGLFGNLTQDVSDTYGCLGILRNEVDYEKVLVLIDDNVMAWMRIQIIL